MKRWLSAVVVCGCAVMLIAGCRRGTSVTPEEQRPAEQMQPRSQPTDTGEGGATTRPGTVEGTDIGLARIHFDTDKWTIREDARQVLEANAAVLKGQPEVRILIEGHCDERNTVEYNLALGERRAAAAKEYLVRLGIDAARISTISYGEERPAALGHDEGSWWENRRCEFAVTQ